MRHTVQVFPSIEHTYIRTRTYTLKIRGILINFEQLQFQRFCSQWTATATIPIEACNNFWMTMQKFGTESNFTNTKKNKKAAPKTPSTDSIHFHEQELLAWLCYPLMWEQFVSGFCNKIWTMASGVFWYLLVNSTVRRNQVFQCNRKV